MSPEFSISVGRDGIDDNIQLGYSRAQENLKRAIELAEASPWVWGKHASFDDYKDTDPLTHQLTGELPLQRKDYRTEEYNRCNDSVSKELSPTFKREVYERGAAYLEISLDPALDREERVITLDFAKQYLLTMFHAVQYPLRTRVVNIEEMTTIGALAEAVRSATRAFYLNVLGHDDERVRSEVENAKRTFEDPDVHNAVEAAELAHFKAQEMDQPLTILASSLLATNDYPDTEIIYGLPAGGTQHAIVTQLLFELKRDHDVVRELEYLPISTHSTGKAALAGKVSLAVEAIINRSNPRGKHVLICEDNTNTGTTLSLASDIVSASGPKDLHISITEFDPRRLEVKYRYPEPRAQIANYAHPDFGTAVGVVPITLGKYPDIQMRKMVALSRKATSLYAESARADTEAASYETIPEKFFTDFYQVYRDVLRYCGDTYGYRSPHLVSAALVRHYAEKGMIGLKDVEHSFRSVLEVARASTLYPYLPAHVKELLNASQESLDYSTNGPWLRKGAQALIREILDYSVQANSSVTIWTKGDGGTTSNPPRTLG